MSDRVQRSLAGMRVVRAYGLEAFEADDLPVVESEAESPDAAHQEPGVVIDYSFPGHEGFLEHVTFRTTLVAPFVE